MNVYRHALGFVILVAIICVTQAINYPQDLRKSADTGRDFQGLSSSWVGRLCYETFSDRAFCKLE